MEISPANRARVYSDLYVYGNISFKVPSPLEFFSSNIARNYNVIARSMTNDPVENTALTLSDKNSKLVWNGTTDSFGAANFNVTFTDSNYTSTLKLEAARGDLSGGGSISFLSDTPVTLFLGRHDIAIANVTPSKTVVGQGSNLRANVTIANQGDFYEPSVFLSLYANTTAIGTQTVFLMNGTSTSIIVDGTATSSLAYGNYTLSAYAWPVPDEMNTTNNNCTGRQITITIPSDIDGDFKVTLSDLVALARAYSVKLGDSNWNANADIDGNSARAVWG